MYTGRGHRGGKSSAPRRSGLKRAVSGSITDRATRARAEMTRTHFAFKLESIRTLRKHTELVAMRRLAHELDRAAQLDDELGSAVARLSEACAPSRDVTTAGDLSVRQAYLERRERELGEARLRTEMQAEHVAHGRTQLASAARDRETLDRLEDRQRAVHQKLERRAERVDADEISLAMRRRHLGGAA
jgi:flagellar export protein FliJ